MRGVVRTTRHVRTVTAVLVLAAVLVACTGGGQDEAAESEPPAATVPETPSEDEPSATPSASPSPERPLDDQWYEDSDDNAVPDFIEEDLGYDPNGEDCIVGECPEAAEFVAPDGSPREEENTLLILDASGSMAGDDGAGTIKIDAARGALERLVVGTPDTVNLGLLVYGHRGNNQDAGRAESCAGIDLFAPLGELTPESVPGVLGQFQPTGWTPIGASLTRAAEVFAGTEGGRNRVILVTDGIETCDGDPVGAARSLADSGVAVTVDVVGFDVESDADRQALEAIAEASGGTYTDAADAARLNDYIDEALRARNDARQAWLCLREAVTDSAGCINQLFINARLEVNEARNNEEPTSPEWDALGDIGLAIDANAADRHDALDAEYDPVVERLEAAYREAEDRYAQRYGQPISARFVCPYADPPSARPALLAAVGRLPV